MAEDISNIFNIFERTPTLSIEGPESVIFIKSHLVPDDPDGIPSNLEEFARILKKLEYDVRVLSCDKDVPVSPRPFQVVQWFPKSIFGLFKSSCSLTKLFATACLILYYKTSLKLSLVVVEELSFIIPVLNKLGGLRVVYIEDVLKQLPVNNQVYHYRQRNRRHQLYYLQYVDKIVVSTKISRRIIEHQNLKIKNRPILLYPNIEAPKFLESNYYPGNHMLDLLDNDSVIILTFGEYTPESNFQLAINGFRRILKKCRSIRHLYDNFFLIVCGNCRNKQQVDYMQKMMEINKYGDNLIFIRNMPFEFRLGLLQQAKCVLFPSVYYNHDQILMMQCIRLGKIVIATKCDITDELVEHDHNGYICRKPSPKQFEKYIAKVLTEPKVHDTMGQVGSSLFCDYYGEAQYTVAVKGILGYYDYSQFDMKSSGSISRELTAGENYFGEEPSGDSQGSQEDSNGSGDVFEDSVDSLESADQSDQTSDQTPVHRRYPVARALTFSDEDSPNEDDFRRDTENFQVSTPKEAGADTSIATKASKSELDLDICDYLCDEDVPASYFTYQTKTDNVKRCKPTSPRPGCSKEPDFIEEIDEYEDDVEFLYDEDLQELEGDDYQDFDSDTDTETVVGKKMDSDSDSNTLSEDYSPNQSYSMHSEPEDGVPDLPMDDVVQPEDESTKISSGHNVVGSIYAAGDTEGCKGLPIDSVTDGKKLPRISSWVSLSKESRPILKRNESCPGNWKPLQNQKK